jgi:hypothetical protein
VPPESRKNAHKNIIFMRVYSVAKFLHTTAGPAAVAMEVGTAMKPASIIMLKQ